MRTNAKSTIYLSDFLTVPMPLRASSRRALRRKLKSRRILWALLPYLAEGLLILLALTLTLLGAGLVALGLQG